MLAPIIGKERGAGARCSVYTLRCIISIYMYSIIDPMFECAQTMQVT